MSLFRRSQDPIRAAYTTEPATDPESGEPCIGLRSQMTGGHIVSFHDTEADANAEADKLAALWRKSLR